MSDIQQDFDGIMALLKQNSGKNGLVERCLADTEGEIAFVTPANREACPSRDILLNIYRLNVGEEKNGAISVQGYNALLAAMQTTANNNICLWGIDTHNGCYTIFTGQKATEFVGIIRSDRTLTDIRRDYFLQRERLEKIGEKPLYDYEKHEKTFFNRKFSG